MNKSNNKFILLVDIRLFILYFFSNTPLHFVGHRNVTTVVKLLVSHGADINAVNNHMDSPLHIASQKGKITVVKELIKYDASLTMKNSWG